MDAGQGLENLSTEELEAMEALITQERNRRAQIESVVAEANALSLAYHKQAPQIMHNGVMEWQTPALPMMGYYSGAAVWHNNQGWVNNQPGVNLTEPGADGHTWTTWEEVGIWVGDNPPPTDNETPIQDSNPELEPAPEPAPEPEVDNPTIIDVN